MEIEAGAIDIQETAETMAAVGIKEPPFLRRLTKKQLEIFVIICFHVGKHLEPPTLARMRDLTPGKKTRQSIFNRVEALVRKGYLINKGGKYYPTKQGVKQRMEDFGGNLARLDNDPLSGQAGQ